jgi:methionyl-tRNA formyltransferase
VRRVRTIFLGSGRFGVESLRRLARHPALQLAGVVTAPPRPAGRRQALTATPIDQAASDLGIATVLRPARLRAPDSLHAVLALRPGLAVLADYGQLVPRPILDFPHGALNLHPSLLPRHRGASPIPATILAGDRRTGVTLMRMDEGLDTGPIVAVAHVALDGAEDAPSLEDRLAAVAADLLERSVAPWLAAALTPRPQPDDGATLTGLLRREDGRLDPTMSAQDLERRVRAYRPWPGTFLERPGGRLIVHRAHLEAGNSGDVPGRLVAHGDGLAVTATGGRLVLGEVQPAGGRRMSAAELRRGRPDLVEAG